MENLDKKIKVTDNMTNILFEELFDLKEEKIELEKQLDTLRFDIETDPAIEPEGGPVADKYRDELNKLEGRLKEINESIRKNDEWKNF